MHPAATDSHRGSMRARIIACFRGSGMDAHMLQNRASPANLL